MFEHPAALWFLLAAPLTVLPAVHAWRAGRRKGALALATVRLLTLLAIVLLVAGARVRSVTSVSGLTIVAAVDQSRSVSPEQQRWMRAQLAKLADAMGPRDQLAIMAFGADARLLSSSAPPLPRLDAMPVDRTATDIAGALSVASAFLPDDRERRIWLLTDGNETTGRAWDEVSALLKRKVKVFASIPPPPQHPRLSLLSFNASDPVHAQTRFALRVGVASEATTTVRARLTVRQETGASEVRIVELRPGLNHFELPYRIAVPGAHLLAARLEPLDQDEELSILNARAEVGVSVVQPAKIAVVSEKPLKNVVRALTRSGYMVTSMPPQKLPDTVKGLLEYQAVVLADVTPKSLGETLQTTLERYVRDYGGGLVVTGGVLRESAFSASPLERALPIRFRPQPPPPMREPVAIYLCIDRSNSMGYNSRYPAVHDNERLRYAKEAALGLLRQLGDTDFVGVIAFDSEPYVLAPLAPLGENRKMLEDRISRLAPGGGTDFKQALEIAERELVHSGVSTREVILLTDGDTNRPYHDHDDLIAAFERDGVPVSTVRIGPDTANLRLLSDFARRTGGVFYRVQDIEMLPELFVRLSRDVMKEPSPRKIRVFPETQSMIISGIAPGQIPPLRFVASTKPKARATVVLSMTDGDRRLPLLVAWQYGFGRSAVFAAAPESLGSVSWIHWPRYAQFWSQLVSWLMRPGLSGEYNLHAEVTAGREIRLVAEGGEALGDNLFCRITGGRIAVDIPMTPSDNDRYSGTAGPLARGHYTVALIRKAGDTETVLASRPLAVTGHDPAEMDEVRLSPPDRDLLRRLAVATGGSLQPKTDELLRHDGASVPAWRSLAPVLIPFALGLLLGDAWLRRRLFAV